MKHKKFKPGDRILADFHYSFIPYSRKYCPETIRAPMRIERIHASGVLDAILEAKHFGGWEASEEERRRQLLPIEVLAILDPLY